MNMIIACATDDGKNFISRHFGDAEKYLIYELRDGQYVLTGTILNTTGEEEQHADPKKAKGIVSILAEKNVNVGLTKVFGPNIKRIKKHLVPVLVSVDSIEKGLAKVLEASGKVIEAIDIGYKRKHIDLR